MVFRCSFSLMSHLRSFVRPACSVSLLVLKYFVTIYLLLLKTNSLNIFLARLFHSLLKLRQSFFNYSCSAPAYGFASKNLLPEAVHIFENKGCYQCLLVFGIMYKLSFFFLNVPCNIQKRLSALSI